MNSVKIDLGGTELDGKDWIDRAQDMDRWSTRVNTVMILGVPLNVGKFSSGFSRRSHCVS